MTRASPAHPAAAERGVPRTFRVALLGNPNTGKTTLFNRLCGLRHRTSNFPGTTQEARVGRIEVSPAGGPAIDLHLIDMPGVYSLELELSEARVCREVLDGRLSPRGEPAGEPDAICVVADATNLARGVAFAGEALRRRLPTLVLVNMADAAEREGVAIDADALRAGLGCEVIVCSARTGAGLGGVVGAMLRATIPTHTPPGTREGVEQWSADLAVRATRPLGRPRGVTRDLTNRLDHVLVHPIAGPAIFALVMAAMFYVIFRLAVYPMDWIDGLFAMLGGAAESILPAGLVREFVVGGVVSGVAATVIFVPQICLLFFMVSLLEDTGYLARAALMMDRLLRPFGLPGHAFVPLLGAHACALPGILACRAIPDPRERLAAILVAPFMTCSARLPVYVLVISVLFPGRPGAAALAFVGCYILGIAAGLASALLARRTILRGRARPMMIELPSYKRPSVRTAMLTTYDRGRMFLRKAGTNILAICIVLWWLGAFPKVAPPPRVDELRLQAAALVAQERPDAAAELTSEADALEASDAKARSFVGRLGRVVQPVFEPLGFDWQMTVGVLTSFLAREVFVSTMAVIVTGSEDAEDEGVRTRLARATRDDGRTPVFTPAASWALLVYFVLAMQCLPTLAVTAREAGGVKWALLQLAWMSGVAYAAAAIVHALAA